MFLAVRLPKLGTDIINPDAVNWHYRSEQFVVGLKTQDWLKTYQHYHPGVTLMWIMGPVVEIIKHVDPKFAIYDRENFLVFHTASKYALMFVQLVLTLFSLYILSKVTDFKKAFFVVLLFTFEPFFLGNSRLLHLDVLMTLFLFNGLVLTYWAVRSGGGKYLWRVALAGILLSLAFLTKSIALGGFVFAFLYVGWYAVSKKSPKLLLALTAAFVVTTFVVFPALWVRPVYVLSEIFSEGERVGVRKGHGQIVLGEYTRDAGPGFYPLVLAMKVSPFIWIGMVIYLFFLIKNIRAVILKRPFEISLELFLFIFYFGYLVVMTVPSKKIDRYMVPMFPILAYLAYLGYEKMSKLQDISKLKDLGKFRNLILTATFALFVAFPVIKYFPYHFTYTSPLFGSAKKANSILAEKPFGVGIPALRDFIFTKYGEYPKLGFFDVKPMRAIYMSSRICDIRVCGTGDYDLLILGINEEIPEKVINSGTAFEYDSSFRINGLEYWKIYVKRLQTQ